MNKEIVVLKEERGLNLRWVERISYLLDEQFRIPGTKFRFGLDPLMNLVPILGNIPGFLLSVLILYTIARKGFGSKIVVLMTLNIAIDSIIGAIPVIGQVFDFYYKANSRNIKLLKAHYQEGRYQGSGAGVLVAVLLLLLFLIGGFLFIVWRLADSLFNMF